MRNQLTHQRRAGLAILRELTGRQKQTGRTVSQHVGVIHLLALELRHLHRIHLRWRGFAILQQLAGVLALGIGATEKLAETAGLELHLAAALVAFQAGTFIALDAVLALLDLVTGAIRVVAADMQLLRLVEQIGIHRGAADRTAVLAKQHAGFGLALVIGRDLVTWDQVDRRLAALLRRQAVAGAAKEHAGGSGTDHHRPTADLAGDIGQGRLVGTHAVLAGFGNLELLAEVTVELVQHVLPVALALGYVVEMLFHAGSEAVIHQIVEALGQTLSDDVTHLLRIETAVVQRDVAAVLDRRNDRGVGGRPADTALLHLLDQAGFGVARRRLGEVLARVELEQLHVVALVHLWQDVILTGLALLRHDLGVAVELQDAALGAQLEIAGSDGHAGGQVLCRWHLAGNELAPDQLIEALGITLHA